MATSTWTVKGKLAVKHILPELIDAFGTSGPLANVTLKVSARSKIPFGWGTWNSWGNIKTNDKGEFSISKKKGSDRRQFKIEVLFDDETLRVKEGGSFSTNNDGFPIEINFLDLTDKDWFEIHNDKDRDAERKAGVHDLGTITVDSGRVQRLGDIWDLYKRVIFLFRKYGLDYSFQKKVLVKFPMNFGGTSYSNPLNNNVYIANEFDSAGDFSQATNTLIHELMHLWSYHHGTGEDGMAWQLIKHGSTHQDRENTTFVPFQEAFAEWSSYRVLNEITNGKVDNFMDCTDCFNEPLLPLTREHISEHFSTSEKNVSNMDYSERGWHSLFNILTFKELEKCDFNRSGTYAKTTVKAKNSSSVIGLSFIKILSIFLKDTNAGYKNYISKKELNFDSFLQRANKITPLVTKSKVKQILVYLDPKDTRNPADF